MQKRTKIVATLGPASSSLDVLKKMIGAGLNVVRENFSHGTVEDHKKRVETVRKAAKEMDRIVGILADLQGPKIRVSKFENGKAALFLCIIPLFVTLSIIDVALINAL